MADFTRFISYLYDYRAGERSRNLGFAKVESRQGMCRLTVCLNHGQVVQRNMALCGYIAEGERVHLVRLGEMERGTRERQWRFPADNLGNCGVTLEQLAGLILLNEERSFFLLSVWHDGQWSAEDIRQAPFWERPAAVLTAAQEESMTPETAAELFLGGMLPGETPVGETSVGGMLSGEPPVGELAVEGMLSGEPPVGESSVGGLLPGALSAGKTEDEHGRYQADAENDKTAAKYMVVSGGTQPGQSDLAAGVGQSEMSLLSSGTARSEGQFPVSGSGQSDMSASGSERSAAAVSDFGHDRSAASASDFGAEQPNVPVSVPGSVQPDLPAVAPQPAQLRESVSAAPDSWRTLCKLFPAARPFEPSAWEVLCISLQDIGRLSPENWVWGNNHFLLHGFYQYHHLILARNRVENRIYLGVPGEFGVNEKFMAAMFGLHQFQRERQGKSEKGYWLTPVRL